MKIEDMTFKEKKLYWKGRELNRKHSESVRDICLAFRKVLKMRGLEHDASKMEDPEKVPFAMGATALRDLSYGTEEYRKGIRENLGEAVKHHYSVNRHHPEHFENGVDDMTLIDVMEMLSDWMVAVKRHADGDIYKSIEINTERFNLSPQLANILRNTVKAFEDDSL